MTISTIGSGSNRSTAGRLAAAIALLSLLGGMALSPAYADGLQKFTPAFSTLYDSMSDGQKNNADAIFRARGDRALKHKVSRHG